MAYKTIAAITASHISPSGVVFTVVARDETKREFKLGAPINSNSSNAVRMAQLRLADICRACDTMMIVDTETLHNIDFIIEHDGKHILSIKPIKVTVEKLVPVGFWAWLLWRMREPD